MESLGFSIYKIILSANRDHFTSSFPIWMPFISFSCLIQWPELLVPCGIEVMKASILTLFLVLEEKFPVFAAHDVLGFHVQVQHALFMHVCQRIARFIEDGYGFLFIKMDVLFDVVI